MTMQVIQHIELGSAASNITFSSIPQDGTDLFLVMSLRFNTSSDTNTELRFNGSTSGYSSRDLYGTGSSSGSSSNYVGTDAIEGGVAGVSTFTANTFSNQQVYIPNYTSSNNKSASTDSVTENNGTLSYQQISAGLWSNSAAITSISASPINGYSWVAGSSATLYKITKGSDGTTTVS